MTKKQGPSAVTNRPPSNRPSRSGSGRYYGAGDVSHDNACSLQRSSVAAIAFRLGHHQSPYINAGHAEGPAASGDR
jgi:hypothetical protein